MRADRRSALPLRPAGRADRQVDDGRLLEGNVCLLREPVRAVHLAVIAGEDHHGVLPQVQPVESLDHLVELRIHETHAVDEVIAVPEPEIPPLIRDVAIV